MNSWLIIGIGLLAQCFFSARILVQWIMSERAHKVLSPSLFWILSLAGSYLLCIYGWLRNDFAIVLGQIIAYYIYIWNLNIKGDLKRLSHIVKTILLITPPILLLWGIKDVASFIDTFFYNEDIPLWLLIYGSSGQILFTFRFIYQWYYSQKMHKSVLPAGFWVLSLAGALCILSYGIFRTDPVLILGQSFGIAAYSRNLWILNHSKEKKK